MRFSSQKVRSGFKLGIPVWLTLLSICASTPTFADSRMSAFDQGRERMSRRDYDGALMSFGEALGYSSENPKSYLYRGQCFYHLKNYQSALDDFTHAISILPDASETYLWRGNTYASMGQDSSAIVDYQKAIKLDPNLAKQYFAVPPEKRTAESQPSVTMVGRRGARTELDVNGGMTAKKPSSSHAVDLYKQAMDSSYPNGLTADISAAASSTTLPVVALPVDSDPSKKPAVISSSKISMEETSGKDKSKAVKRAKKVDESFDQVGHDKFKKDIDQYTEALRGDNGNAANYFHRGRAHQYLREYAQALQDFSDAIRLSPQSSQFYLARASIYMLMKKPLLAKADVQSAQSVDPTVPAKVTLDLDPPQP